MINTKFEAYKIERELRRSGRGFEFYRNGVNEFGEPDSDSQIELGGLSGIYHEQNSNVQTVSGDTTITRTKKIPMILCLYSSWQELGLKPGDFTFVNSKKLYVSGCVNVQEWGIVGDISLEHEDDWSKD